MKNVLVAVGVCLISVMTAVAQWTPTSGNIHYNGGNVGIGTAPGEIFEIQGTSASTLFGKLTNLSPSGTGGWLVQNDGSDGDTYQAEFGVRGSARAVYGSLLPTEGYMYSNNTFTMMADSPTGILKFASGGNAEHMRIDAAGNVSILVGNLSVHGTVTGSNIQASYQDVAEWVPVTEPVAPGTVVVLNRNKSNEVMAAMEAYDTRVAGVVSAQPGITLGIESASKAKIATTGRVKVRVDATSHPIEIGRRPKWPMSA